MANQLGQIMHLEQMNASLQRKLDKKTKEAKGLWKQLRDQIQRKRVRAMYHDADRLLMKDYRADLMIVMMSDDPEKQIAELKKKYFPILGLKNAEKH